MGEEVFSSQKISVEKNNCAVHKKAACKMACAVLKNLCENALKEFYEKRNANDVTNFFQWVGLIVICDA